MAGEQCNQRHQSELTVIGRQEVVYIIYLYILQVFELMEI
jgi:hypothetical protein